QLDQVGAGHLGATLEQQQRDDHDEGVPVRAQQRAEQRPGPGPQPDHRSSFGSRPFRVFFGGPPPPSLHLDTHETASSMSDSAEADRTARYSGTVASSSEWVPTATISPSARKATRSASATVDGRWTTMSAVVPYRTRASASSTRASVCTSKADSGSSRTSTR